MIKLKDVNVSTYCTDILKVLPLVLLLVLSSLPSFSFISFVKNPILKISQVSNFTNSIPIPTSLKCGHLSSSSLFPLTHHFLLSLKFPTLPTPFQNPISPTLLRSKISTVQKCRWVPASTSPPLMAS